MLKNEIMDMLRPLTDEEMSAIEQSGKINTSLYTDGNIGMIDGKKLLSQGKLITVRNHPRFVHFPEHTHNYIEAVYMCSGESVHIINGEKVVLKEGELLFMGRGARQEILPTGEDDIAVNLIIQPEFFDSETAMLIDEKSPLRRFVFDCMKKDDDASEYIHFKVADVLPVQNLIENLIWSLLKRISGKRKINQMTMGLLLLHLTNYAERITYKSEEDRAIIQALSYIEEYYKDGSLTELSKKLHYDFSWYSREIKRRTGNTYTELVQKKRLAQAAFLLKRTDMSIENIAANVGYENVSYFYRLFKTAFGVPPKKYRLENGVCK